MPTGVYPRRPRPSRRPTRLGDAERLYLEQKLSGRETAKALGIPAPTVFNWLRIFRISRTKREAVSLYFQEHPEHTERFQQAGTKAQIGRKQSPEEIAKRVASMKGYRHSDETKQKMSIAQKGRHWTKEQRERCLPIVMANRRQRPTRLETLLQEVIQRHSLPYKYVGDGYTWIAGRCPDFLNIDGQKKVVEVFGRWWHDPAVNPHVKPQYTECNTRGHYARYGFDCVIIWEEQLSDESAIVSLLR